MRGLSLARGTYRYAPRSRLTNGLSRWRGEHSRLTIALKQRFVPAGAGNT
ncbi:hypothetical protein KCP78_14100 [Salmonella enterica subsp. enterica]|nr:hypothetical protein KCP78_14100 [Salmonella enterica subsp. enterica]